MYEFEIRTRYSEYDENFRIKLPGLLNYLQDASQFHSLDSGVDNDYYKAINRAWFIDYWDIRIDSLPAVGQRLICGTSPHDIKGLFALRNFWIRSEITGQYLVRADSFWILINLENMRPVRPTEDDLKPYGRLDDVLGMNLDSHRINIKNIENFTKIREVPVSGDLIDSNHHVNNISYIAVAYGALLESGLTGGDFFPSRIRAEYRVAAKAGDTLLINAARVNDEYYLAILSGDGRDFCHIIFS